MLTIICRVLHIAATCTSLGGLFYARMVLLPTVSKLSQPLKDEVLNNAIKRFSYIKWSGIAVIVVTGIINLIYIYPTVQQKSLYTFYFTLKMAGAVGLLTITSLLAIPSEKLQFIQKRRAFWSGINIICGLIILIGATLMRSVSKSL